MKPTRRRLRSPEDRSVLFKKSNPSEAMRNAAVVIIIFEFMCGITADLVAQVPRRGIELETEDGIIIYGDSYVPDGKTRALILLFHQGGASGRAEYAPIIPRLIQAGYAVVSIDQRRGGDRFGGENRTVATLEGREFSYCDAYADVEAAFRFARSLEPSTPVVAWGSSYSSALSLKLAVDHPEEIAGVLAFSPSSGDPLEGCRPESYSTELGVPALVLRPAREAEIPSVREQLAAFSEQGLDVYVADPGTHGSSMLVAERVDGDVEPTWAAVLAFLDEALASRD